MRDAVLQRYYWLLACYAPFMGGEFCPRQRIAMIMESPRCGAVYSCTPGVDVPFSELLC